MSFVFYDTETTGTDPFFDQILQFAAIKTDHEFRVEEEFEIRCRLRPHIIPAAAALCVTGVSVSQCNDATLPSHLEMAQTISRKFVEWQGSVFLGWNTIRFDEEFLRQMFYQSLLPPYQTNTNGNSRADLLPLAQAAFLDLPKILNVPRGQAGNPSFKLDSLAPANGFPHLNAHDALADVQATIHVARILREGAPQHWSNLVRFANKRAASDFVETERVVVTTEAHFGRPSQYALTNLGTHPQIGSEFFCFDLAHDPEVFVGLSDTELLSALSQSPKPVRRIKTNRSPVLMSGDDVDAVNGIDIETLEQRADLIDRIDGLREALLRAAIINYEREYDNQEVEQQIYDGFTQDPDRRRMERFHAAPWEERFAICRTFEDVRIQKLGMRLVCENEPKHAPPALAEKYAAFCRRRMSDCEGSADPPWRSLEKAREELGKARETFVDPDGILDEYDAYLRQLEANR